MNKYYYSEGHSNRHCLQDTSGCNSETGGIDKNHLSHHSCYLKQNKTKKSLVWLWEAQKSAWDTWGNMVKMESSLQAYCTSSESMNWSQALVLHMSAVNEKNVLFNKEKGKLNLSNVLPARPISFSKQLVSDGHRYCLRQQQTDQAGVA